MQSSSGNQCFGCPGSLLALIQKVCDHLVAKVTEMCTLKILILGLSCRVTNTYISAKQKKAVS